MAAKYREQLLAKQQGITLPTGEEGVAEEEIPAAIEEEIPVAIEEEIPVAIEE